MKALVHAEMLKLRSTRTPAWLLLATLGLVVLMIAVNASEWSGVAASGPPTVTVGAARLRGAGQALRASGVRSALRASGVRARRCASSGLTGHAEVLSSRRKAWPTP